MNVDRAPRLSEHPRTADEIAVVLSRLLERAKFCAAGTDPLRDALVRIAARYGEVVTQCLNAAPDLHLKAFAGLLGGHARPAEAARVHLSFIPAAGSAPAEVPMNTRVAAAPAEGDNEPIVFETLADLKLVRAEVVRALFADSGHRSVADLGAMLSAAGIDGDPLASAVPTTDALHISQRAAFGLSGLRQVRVRVDVQDVGSHDASSRLEWVVQTPNGNLPLAVEYDTTGGLTRSGEVVLAPPATWPVASVEGIESLWLTLRLRRPPEAAPVAPRWRPPRLSGLGIRAAAATAPQPAVAACHDAAPLDLSKDVFPFGERPRFGSVFQVLCPTFGEPGAKVEMLVQLTNPETATASPIPPVSREGRPIVMWEIFTMSGFQTIAANDGTRSLTQDGSLIFTVPAEVGAITIAGKSGAWLRARLASGHYGRATETDGAATTALRAPAIRSLAVKSTLERGPLVPECLVSQGALVSLQIDPHIRSPVDAFQQPDIDGPALYIALKAQLEVLKGRTISWHVRPALPTSPLVLGEPGPSSAAPHWQMRCVDGWRDVSMRDGSVGLTRSGIVKLKLPEDLAHWRGCMADPAAKLAWLRIVWPLEQPPRSTPAIPIGLTINSVAAQQSQLLRNEFVGSSNGRASQVFRALRTPIVDGVLLQVREADDKWVSWREVKDISRSHAASRDFMLDRSTGELRFGNGRFGRIPMPGANNICLREYSTGGGTRGNRPIGSIAQLLSAVPAVESVVNVEPAAGGLDADDAARVRDHALGWLRHRDRAICTDDFVDLALRASPEVARAICIAGRDLGVALPPGRHERPTQAGVVSIVVIPRGNDFRPQPTLDLLATVKAYLDARRPAAGRLVIVGPIYARVTVTLQAAAKEGWSLHRVQAECARQIVQFLHPLSGGPEGRGWALGERPHRSDIYGLLSAIDGFDVARGLSLTIDAPTGRSFIVSAGAIDVASWESP